MHAFAENWNGRQLYPSSIWSNGQERSEEAHVLAGRAEVRRRGFTGLELCLSVLRWLLDVIYNVNFHHALLRFHSQTQLAEHLEHREPVGDVG